MTSRLFDDLDDFAGPVNGVTGLGPGTTFDPPINAMRQPIQNLNGWSQTINVANVLSDNIGSDTDQALGSTDLMRVTVTVNYQAPNRSAPDTMTRLTWIIGN